MEERLKEKKKGRGKVSHGVLEGHSTSTTMIGQKKHTHTHTHTNFHESTHAGSHFISCFELSAPENFLRLKNLLLV